MRAGPMEKVYGHAWEVLPALHEEWRALLRSGVECDLYGTGRMEAAADPVGPRAWNEYVHPQVEQVSRELVVVPVQGVLGRKWGMMESLFFGGYSLGLLDEQLLNIAGDEAVEVAVLHITSPGGLAGEWAETVELMRQIRQETGKRLVAYADTVCASAAMPLALACDGFFAAPSAKVGSMGTICAGIDSSEAFTQAGLERIVVASGTLKGMGMSGKPWTDEERAHLEAKVARYHGRYRAAVTAERSIPEECFETAEVYDGRDAPEGLLDGVVNRLEGLVAMLLDKE